MIISNDPNKFDAEKFNMCYACIKNTLLYIQPIAQKKFLIGWQRKLKKKWNQKSNFQTITFNLEIKGSFLYTFFSHHVR